MTPVDPATIDNRYLHALFIDYSAPAEPERGIPGISATTWFASCPDSDDLLLGRAFLAVGSRRIPVGWFALEPLSVIGNA